MPLLWSVRGSDRWWRLWCDEDALWFGHGFWAFFLQGVRLGRDGWRLMVAGGGHRRRSCRRWRADGGNEVSPSEGSGPQDPRLGIFQRVPVRSDERKVSSIRMGQRDSGY